MTKGVELNMKIGSRLSHVYLHISKLHKLLTSIYENQIIAYKAHVRS